MGSWYGLLTKREVKMAGYWPTSFICMFMDRDEVEVTKLAKKNEANIQSSWPKTLGEFFLAEHGGYPGSPERAR